jgi:hypothetical protein
MDSGTLVLLIPILALAIGFIAILKLPRKVFGGHATPELEARMKAMEQEVGTLRQELGEAQERIDFAERLLARGEETRRGERPGP